MRYCLKSYCVGTYFLYSLGKSFFDEEKIHALLWEEIGDHKALRVTVNFKRRHVVIVNSEKVEHLGSLYLIVYRLPSIRYLNCFCNLSVFSSNFRCLCI